MFNNEWTSIAMGNAIDELKQKASYMVFITFVYIMDGSKNIRFFFFFEKNKKYPMFHFKFTYYVN